MHKHILETFVDGFRMKIYCDINLLHDKQSCNFTYIVYYTILYHSKFVFLYITYMHE